MHVAREMMFGYRDEFDYMECASCGCVQNASVPSDLGKYYGEGYYSLVSHRQKRNAAYNAMKAMRTRAYLGGTGLLGRALLRWFGPPGLPGWVRKTGVRQGGAILEVGCGSGALLLAMRSEGFTDLTGADPYIKEEIDYGNGLKILKADVTALQGPYELIVLEHSFEHMPDPHKVIQVLRSLLSPDGILVISIPLAMYAWQKYGVNWIQLDAPRHLYLHTERSFRIVAKHLTLLDIEYDSNAVQFWGSEQYSKDIPLLDERSYRVNPAKSLFSAEAIEAFEAQAAELNEKKIGDQAIFYLRR
jgi:SAM-dependent methyltransferase